MSQDRFVTFDKRKPTRDEVESVLRNYFDEAADIKWADDRWIATLPGKWSFPFVEIVGYSPRPREIAERWIEVYVGKRSKVGNLDVITRQQDEYTNVLADGLARMFARYWEGKLDDGS